MSQNDLKSNELSQVNSQEFQTRSFQNSHIRQNIKVGILNNEDLMADFITFNGLSDGKEHLAIGLGCWTQSEIVNVRVHSECLTGDVFGSCRCDCGPQLEESLKNFSNSQGIVLYLRQEGRGIGFYNKIDAYKLQDQGLDTFEANKKLNFQDDQRSFDVAAQMLNSLNVKKINLFTNNPQKIEQLKKFGVKVENVFSTSVFCNSQNQKYLEAKIKKGHLINLKES